MCHGIICFPVADLVRTFGENWPDDLTQVRDLPFIVRSLNEEKSADTRQEAR